jgi:hypothetical protein
MLFAPDHPIYIGKTGRQILPGSLLCYRTARFFARALPHIQALPTKKRDDIFLTSFRLKFNCMFFTLQAYNYMFFYPKFEENIIKNKEVILMASNSRGNRHGT